MDGIEKLEALKQAATDALEQDLDADLLIERLERYSHAFEQYLASDPECALCSRGELEELLEKHRAVLERAEHAQDDTAAARRSLHSRVRGVLKYADDPIGVKGFWRGRKG